MLNSHDERLEHVRTLLAAPGEITRHLSMLKLERLIVVSPTVICGCQQDLKPDIALFGRHNTFLTFWCGEKTSGMTRRDRKLDWSVLAFSTLL